MLETQPEIIFPKIWAFKGAYKNSIAAMNHFKENLTTWEDWYTFGTHTGMPSTPHYFDGPEFPTYEQWKLNVLDRTSDPFMKEIEELFYYATKQYVEENDIVLPNWNVRRMDIATYYPNAGVDDDNGPLAMNYHTDYQQELEGHPGAKFAITCLFYLNDDYIDGDVCFKVLNEDRTEYLYDGCYKPTAGDIFIFPSTHPYYHGVLKTRGNNDGKCFIRTYWTWIEEANQRYLDGVAEYGEEKWLEMEKERHRAGSEAAIWNITSQDIDISSKNWGDGYVG